MADRDEVRLRRPAPRSARDPRPGARRASTRAGSAGRPAASGSRGPSPARPPGRCRRRSRRGLPTAREKPIRRRQDPARRIPATLHPRGQPCPHAVRAVANRSAARRRCAHGALLVAVRAPSRRSLRAPHRGHRRDARAPRGDRADPALAALGRARVGRGPGVGGEYGPYVQSERRPRHLEVAETVPRGGTRVPLLLHDRGARGRARGRPARGPAVHLLAPLPRAERRGARGARGRGRPVGRPPARARRRGVRRRGPRARRRCASSTRSSAIT